MAAIHSSQEVECGEALADRKVGESDVGGTSRLATNHRALSRWSETRRVRSTWYSSGAVNPLELKMREKRVTEHPRLERLEMDYVGEYVSNGQRLKGND
jgi:hypothetical protein